MGRYTVRRLLQFIPVILGTLFLLHYLQTLSFQINGNPIRALFGDRQPPPETIANITRAYGLDDPCLEQTGNPCIGMFVDRLGNLASGNFGQDFNGRDVLDLIVEALPFTLRLTFIAIVFEAIIGITRRCPRRPPQGQAHRQRRPRLDHAGHLGADLRRSACWSRSSSASTSATG